jgi:hypothetical protein
MRHTLLLLLFAGSAQAQQLTLPNSVSVDVNGQADITATSDCDSIRWIAPGSGLIVFEYGRHGGDYKAVTVVGLTPGTYTLRAIGSKAALSADGKSASSKLTDFATTTVTVNGPPAPSPAKTSLFLVPIFDSGTVTPAQASYLSDSAYWAGLAAKGIKYGLIDLNNSASTADAAKFAKWTTSTGLPALIVLDQTSTVIDAIALPGASSGVDAEVAKFAKGN